MVIFNIFDYYRNKLIMKDENLSEYQINTYTYQQNIPESYSGITFLFVLRGNIKLYNYGFSGTVSENELILINRNSDYSIQSDTNNIVIKLQISNHYFTRYYKNYFQYKYIIDADHFPEYKRKALQQLKWFIAKVMMAKLQANDEMYLEANNLISNIMLTLVSYFQEENIADYRPLSQYSNRMDRIVQMINANYHTPLTLKDLSEKEHLSIPYLSRLFKNEVGLGFSQYLSKVRFEHAVYDLINTNKPIYRLIEDHGFADSKTFIQIFKNQYHMTPSEFRKTHKTQHGTPNKQESIVRKTNTKEVQVSTKELLPLLAKIINTAEKPEPQDEFIHIESQLINIHQNKFKDNIPEQTYVIFIGDILELLKENVRNQLLHLKEVTPIQYVEVSYLISGNIISPDILTDEDYPTYSAYNNSDIAISFLHLNNISLVSRIYHENVTNDLENYIYKIKQFIQHAICTYGVDYISSWKFVYYTENKHVNIHDYFEKFDLIKTTIQSINPNIKVGLFYPAIEEDDFSELKNHQQALRTLDFFAFRANFHDLIDKLDANFEILQNEITYIENKAKMLKHQLKHLNINIPTYLIEWNTLTGNTRRTNGSYFRGALIFQTLIGVSRHVAAIGITLNTETQKETSTNYLINVNAIALYYIYLMPRPILFVLKFLHKLDGTIIAKGEDYLITEYQNGYYIVLLNPSIFNPYLSVEENMVSSFRRKKIVSITGIQSGIYQVKRHVFDQKHGALYNEYSRFKTRYGYDYEMIKDLQTTIPELTVYDETIGHHGFTVLSDFDINAIHFYQLQRIHKM